jgi:hypothetical protein
MNQRGLAQIIIILLLIAAASVAGVTLQKNFEKKKPVDKFLEQGKVESPAVSVVKKFCDSYFQGPPALNDVGVMQALNLLSQKATSSISQIGPSPSAALSHFANTQGIPDQGYTIDDVSEETEKVVVKTTWKYSSGSVTKIFTLVKEDSNWKINSLE